MLRFLLRVPIVSSDTAFRLAVVQNSLVTKILVHYSLSLSPESNGTDRFKESLASIVTNSQV